MKKVNSLLHSGAGTKKISYQTGFSLISHYLLGHVALRNANFSWHPKQVVNAVVLLAAPATLVQGGRVTFSRVGGAHHVWRVTGLQHALYVQVVSGPRVENLI